jgi:hypothetical protein
VTCPFCGYRAPRPELHAHLTDVHPDVVETLTGPGQRRYYQLACAWCDDSWRQEIKPRLRDPGFLEEYSREIRVVAFDQFLYHLEAAHQDHHPPVPTHHL